MTIGGGTGGDGSGLRGFGIAVRLSSACSAACFRVSAGVPRVWSWKCSSAVTASTDSSIVCQRHHRLLQPLLAGLRAFMASGAGRAPRAPTHTECLLAGCLPPLERKANGARGARNYRAGPLFASPLNQPGAGGAAELGPGDRPGSGLVPGLQRGAAHSAGSPMTGRRPRMTDARPRPPEDAAPAAVHVVHEDPHPAPRARSAPPSAATRCAPSPPCPPPRSRARLSANPPTVLPPPWPAARVLYARGRGAVDGAEPWLQVHPGVVRRARPPAIRSCPPSPHAKRREIKRSTRSNLRQHHADVDAC